ncbi:MAG TPA: DUF86 domain-containing protein [Petrimonas sp.]|nr:DUF86 domain-containing protein [Petrimonas sp.]
MLGNRDMNVLRHIISYCDDIANTIQRFGLDYETFKADTVYKNAIALCILQIGELTVKLSQEFKESCVAIPWVQIKALRNVVAHQYGKIDEESLWETVTQDIPGLRKYCIDIINQNNVRRISE